MLSLKKIIPVAVTFFLSSCFPCNYVDCAGDNFYGQFRIVSALDGRDLVFGPNKIYDKNQIRFYSLNGTDTTFFNYETIRFPNIGYDSILYVRFLPRPATAFMRLSNGDIDTFNLSYETIHSKCCGTATNITKFQFNNSIDLPANKGTLELKK
jgi:hypothetical protein